MIIFRAHGTTGGVASTHVGLHSREVEEEGGDGEEQRPRERRGQELCLVGSAARHLGGLVNCGGSFPVD